MKTAFAVAALALPTLGLTALVPPALPLPTAAVATLPADLGHGDVPQGQELTAEQEARVQRLEGRLKCPVCRTQSVLESSSFMALEMRAKIRELVSAGRTDREVLDYFVERYGDYILLEPRKQGFGISAYALPVAAVLAGAVFLALGMRRVRRAREAGEGDLAERPGATAAEAAPEGRPRTAAPVGPSELARVDEELRRYTV